MTTQKKSGKKKPSAGKENKTEDHLINLEHQVKEKSDKLLRAYADIQNLQKRMEKELLRKQQETKTQYLLALMDMYELLQKARNDKNPTEGLHAIQKYMEAFMEQEGIRVIDCVGQPFDHTVHHAVCTIENNECNDNQIVEEIKKGYLCRDTLLRPAQVVVAKQKKE